ncbi:MAG: hypothetical protein HY720_05715 [Planctomycetes bacterium]|nr:hypothetical protein [Planctomycetota bacterium]
MKRQRPLLLKRAVSLVLALGVVLVGTPIEFCPASEAPERGAAEGSSGTPCPHECCVQAELPAPCSLGAPLAPVPCCPDGCTHCLLPCCLGLALALATVELSVIALPVSPADERPAARAPRAAKGGVFHPPRRLA